MSAYGHMRMSEAACVALRNYDAMARRYIVVYGEGGTDIDFLFKPEYTGRRMSDDRETRVALKNYDHLLRTHGIDDVALRWDVGMLGYGEDATFIESLVEPGFTDASNDEREDR